MSLRDLAIRVGYQIESGPLAKANEQVDQFKANAIKSESGLKSLGAQAGTTATQAHKAAGTIVSGFDALDSKFKANQKSLEQIDKALSANRGLMVGAFAATAGTIGFAVRKAADFEVQMARVGALARADDKELQALTRRARDLGASTVFSASQAAEGMSYLAMAGFEVGEVIAAMPGLLDTAAAAQSDLGTTADIVSNILSGFNMQAEESTRIADVITAAFTSSNTTLESLGNTMSYVAPVAAGMGYEIEEVAALAGKLGDVGIQGTRAGTALRAIFTRLAAPTGIAATMIEELGIQTADASGNMLPIVDVLGQIEDRTKDMGSAQRAAVLSAIAGQEAQAALGALLDVGTDQLEAYTEELRKSQGVAGAVAAKQMDNLAGSLEELGGAFEEAQITIGNAFIPIIRLGADILRGVINVFNKLPGPIKTVVVTGLGLGAVLSGILLAASFIVPQMIALGKTLPLLRSGFSTVIPTIKGFAASTWAAVAPMLPIIGIALGIAAAIGAVVLVVQDIVSFFQGKGGTVTGRIVEWARNCEWLQRIIGGVSAAFGWVKDRISGLINVAKPILGVLLAPLKGIQAVINGVSNAKEKLGAGVEGVKSKFATFATNIGAGASQVKSTFGSMAERVKGKLGELATRFRENKIGFDIDWSPIERLVTGVKGIVDGIKNWLADHGIKLPAIELPQFPDLLGAVQNWLGAVRDWIAEKFDIGAALSNALNKALDLIPAPLRAIGEKILSFLPHSPAEEGPLRDLDRVGPGLVGGIAAGITDSIPVLDETLRKRLAGTMESMQVPIQPLLDVPMIEPLHTTLDVPTIEPLSIVTTPSSNTYDDPAVTGEWSRPPKTAPNMSFTFEINVDARGATEETARRVAVVTRDEIRRVMEQLLREDYDSMVLEGE